MKWMKVSVTPLAMMIALAALGMGLGVGMAQQANAAIPTCRGLCTIEYQECLAVPPPYGTLAFCRPRYLRCIAACSR